MRSWCRAASSCKPSRQFGRGFTLLEILIVVVILGILAAIIIPSMTNAVADSQTTSTYTEVQKIRRHIVVYRIQHNGSLPPIVEGADTWPGIVPEQLGSSPINAWVSGTNSRKVHLASGPDTAYHRDYGWIFDPATGNVWAAAFDAGDKAYPKPQ